MQIFANLLYTLRNCLQCLCPHRRGAAKQSQLRTADVATSSLLQFFKMVEHEARNHDLGLDAEHRFLQLSSDAYAIHFCGGYFTPPNEVMVHSFMKGIRSYMNMLIAAHNGSVQSGKASGSLLPPIKSSDPIDFAVLSSAEKHTIALIGKEMPTSLTIVPYSSDSQ